MDTALPYSEKIANYYNDVALDYKFFWNLRQNMAIRIGFWDERTKNLSDALRRTDEFLAAEADIRSTDYVLDAGCGVGASAIYLAKTYGCRVMGITLSRHQVDMARKNAQKHKVNHLVEFRVGDFHDTGFANGTFDVVWAVESISHSRDQKKFLREAYRVLNDEGRLIGADYFRSQDKFDIHTEHMRSLILRGLCFHEFQFIGRFEKYMQHAGYENIQFFNVTPNALPSAKILNRLSTVGGVFTGILQILGLRNQAQIDLSWATRYQYIALRDNIHQYRVFSSSKEAIAEPLKDEFEILQVS